MNIKIEISKVVLWATIEDYVGLWELLWEVNTQFSDIPEEQRKQALLEVLQQLLNKDLINLYSCKEPYGEVSILDKSIAYAALTEEKNWQAPDLTDISIRAGATEKGEAFYQTDGIDRKWPKLL